MLDLPPAVFCEKALWFFGTLPFSNKFGVRLPLQPNFLFAAGVAPMVWPIFGPEMIATKIGTKDPGLKAIGPSGLIRPIGDDILTNQDAGAGAT